MVFLPAGSKRVTPGTAAEAVMGGHGWSWVATAAKAGFKRASEGTFASRAHRRSLPRLGDESALTMATAVKAGRSRRDVRPYCQQFFDRSGWAGL